MNSPETTSAESAGETRGSAVQDGPSVVIFGGSGAATAASGLKMHTSRIVTVAPASDNGGGSGFLRHCTPGLPGIGDLRKQLVALSPEGPVADLFADRLGPEYGAGLSNQVRGNLIIEFFFRRTGCLLAALREAEAMLGSRGRVLPSTVSPVSLQARLLDGRRVDGEVEISACGAPIDRVSLAPDAVAAEEVIEAIMKADAILIAPGSLFTSQVASVLPCGIEEALRRTGAPLLYTVNVMTDRETRGFAASDFVRAFARHVPEATVDYALVNTGRPAASRLAKYADMGQSHVQPDCENIRRAGCGVVCGDFLSQTDVLRHDGSKLAAEVVRLIGWGHCLPPATPAALGR